MDIDEQLALAAETDRMAEEAQLEFPVARQRFVSMLPRFMEVRADGTDAAKSEAEALLPRVLTMLEYIDSCMEHARTVRAEMAQVHEDLTIQKKNRRYDG